MLGPIPRHAPRLPLSVTSPRTPVSPHGKRVRRADLPPHGNFGGEPYIEAAVIRLPSGSYGRSTSRLLRPRRPKTPSRQAFHTTQNPAGYPIRAVALLRVRHGQLTRLDSHQLGRSIVGCSLPHTAYRRRSPSAFRLSRQGLLALGAITVPFGFSSPQNSVDLGATTDRPKPRLRLCRLPMNNASRSRACCVMLWKRAALWP